MICTIKSSTPAACQSISQSITSSCEQLHNVCLRCSKPCWIAARLSRSPHKWASCRACCIRASPTRHRRAASDTHTFARYAMLELSPALGGTSCINVSLSCLVSHPAFPSEFLVLGQAVICATRTDQDLAGDCPDIAQVQAANHCLATGAGCASAAAAAVCTVYLQQGAGVWHLAAGGDCHQADCMRWGAAGRPGLTHSPKRLVLFPCHGDLVQLHIKIESSTSVAIEASSAEHTMTSAAGEQLHLAGKLPLWRVDIEALRPQSGACPELLITVRLPAASHATAGLQSHTPRPHCDAGSSETILLGNCRPT